jgi:hypothetical protein
VPEPAPPLAGRPTSQATDFQNTARRRLAPDGSQDTGFHGQELTRDAAVGDHALATGMRLQEFTYLLPWEIPAPPPDPTGVLIPFPVPAGITKGEKLRTTWTSYEAPAAIHGYLGLDGAAATADGSSWRPPRTADGEQARRPGRAGQRGPAPVGVSDAGRAASPGRPGGRFVPAGGEERGWSGRPDLRGQQVRGGPVQPSSQGTCAADRAVAGTWTPCRVGPAGPSSGGQLVEVEAFGVGEGALTAVTVVGLAPWSGGDFEFPAGGVPVWPLLREDSHLIHDTPELLPQRAESPDPGWCSARWSRPSRPAGSGRRMRGWRTRRCRP